MDDARRLFEWRNDPQARGAWLVTAEFDWEEHLTWLERSLARVDRLLFIGVATRTDQEIGLIRFDGLGQSAGDIDAWEISLMVEPAFRGRGWAKKLLAAGVDHLNGVDLYARIRPENTRTVSLFETFGFMPLTDEDGVVLFFLPRKTKQGQS